MVMLVGEPLSESEVLVRMDDAFAGLGPGEDWVMHLRVRGWDWHFASDSYTPRPGDFALVNDANALPGMYTGEADGVLVVNLEYRLEKLGERPIVGYLSPPPVQRREADMS